MKSRFFRSIGLFFLLTCVAAPLVLQADVFIKQKKHTDAFEVMGQKQPAKDEIAVTWMGKDKARFDQGDEKSIIVRADKKIMYIVNHTNRNYIEMPFGDMSDLMSSAISSAGLSDEEKAQAKKLMKGFSSMMKFEVSVNETGEKKKIRDWDCKKYIMNMKMMMGTTTTEIWATEDIKIDYDLYRTLGSAMLAEQPGIKEALEEMKKVKGLSVLSTTTASVMGTDVKTTEELIEVKDKSAPAGAYNIPEGYSKATK